MLALAGLTLVAAPVGSTAQVRVYSSEKDAVARVAAGADSVREIRYRLDPGGADELSEALGMVILDSVVVFHEALVGGAMKRCIAVVNVLGQYQPITIAVVLDAAGRVERVELLVYRESRGAEVRRRAFLRQFKDKHVDSRLRVGDDVRNITGATISSRAVTNGVRLVLRLRRMLDATTTERRKP